MSSNKSAVKSLVGRIGAYALHARHDSKATTAAARATFLEKFEREVDPDGVLPPEERARRATYARKLYFSRLSLKRWQRERRKRGETK